MGHITRWDRAAEARATQALARQLGGLELAATVVKTGIVQIGGTHRAAATEVAVRLKIVDQMVQAAGHAGRLTPHKQAMVRRLTKDYLDEMLAITDEAANEIIDVLLDL
jgi:hypothetical protein